MVKMVKNINTITLNNSTYKDNNELESVNLADVVWKDNSMANAFENCSSLLEVTNINSGVVNMTHSFDNCSSMITAPSLPSAVQDMSGAFAECTSLSTMPNIPSNVNNMSGTFANCSELTIMKSIPNSVINAARLFDGCVKLETVSSLAATFINNLSQAFQGTKISITPNLPPSLTDMSEAFANCTSLETATFIPESVTNMNGTFNGCTALTGDIHIHSEIITDATNCFSGSMDKNVYIPFKDADDKETQTYNAFNTAGYSSETRVNGVLLIDSGEDVDLSDYNYDETVNTTTGLIDVLLTEYTGDSVIITTPHLN